MEEEQLAATTADCDRAETPVSQADTPKTYNSLQAVQCASPESPLRLMSTRNRVSIQDIRETSVVKCTQKSRYCEYYADGHLYEKVFESLSILCVKCTSKVFSLHVGLSSRPDSVSAQSPSLCLIIMCKASYKPSLINCK